ncbi:unnamed protein product [Miscanthus lutarioriparius]|uniref:F-box domain-containing protein n=1 Tax=Miscanthus lutarioriparius TaxID=422564 RepID=A0A811RCC9_9POAL|nr:unnamed protein product [Miscanthus lutarioriparius]
MSARRRTRRRSARRPAAQAVLPDEICEEIFLRLDRRVVSERRFLRRFRSRRSPAVLGFISMDRHQFVPVDPPHRSAPEARALEQAADFTFSFLPNPSASGWCFRHALGGRVLLGGRTSTKTQFEDFLVCDPLRHRYVKIPRIPDELMASTPRTGTTHLLPVLAPAGENDEEESFRVICTVHLKDKVYSLDFEVTEPHGWEHLNERLAMSCKTLTATRTLAVMAFICR